MVRRLEGSPGRLGVDRLLCITDYRLDDGDGNETPLWDGSDGGDVSVLSTAGFLREVRAAGGDERRAIVNGVVGWLASVRADMKPHASGARTCPLHCDVAKLIARPLRFEARCRRRLQRKAPDDVEALEALLGLH